MSKTDKTTPYRVVEKRGECGVPRCTGYPCRHVSISKYGNRLKVLRRKQMRSERTTVRDAIRRGDEPPTTQHRHRALWDAF